MGRDGRTKIICPHRFMQTTAGYWRKVDAFGHFFLQSSKRPEYVISAMWREMQRHSKATQKRAVAEMDKYGCPSFVVSAGAEQRHPLLAKTTQLREGAKILLVLLLVHLPVHLCGGDWRDCLVGLGERLKVSGAGRR